MDILQNFIKYLDKHVINSSVYYFIAEDKNKYIMDVFYIIR